MGLKFYVGEMQAQANDAARMSREASQAVSELQQSIGKFLLAPLSGKAYDSAKRYFNVVYTPLCRSAILTGEAMVNGHKRLISEYQGSVSSIDTDEDLIMSQINRFEQLKRSLEAQMYAAKEIKPSLERRYMNACDSIAKLREKLEKFHAFNARSASFFDEYEACQQTFNNGLAQIANGKAWNASSGTFDLGKLNMTWAKGINEQWKNYEDRQHGIDAKKNKELAKYNVYAVVYYDADGNPKIAWQIEDKDTGYGVENSSLYRYLQKTGQYLDSDLIQFMTYEAYDKKIKDGWRKGINYVTGEKLNKVLGGVVGASQYVEDGVTWLNENELGQAIQMLGFAYASYRMTTTSGTKNVKIQEQANGAENIKQPIKDGPYIKDGKPNGRPQLSGEKKLQFEKDVYNNQVDPDGILRDPNTGETIDWQPGNPRKNKVDFGHTEGNSYKNMFEKYKNGEITLDELKDFQFNSDNFRLETPSANRSHQYE